MIRTSGQNPEKCDDIAEQLILSETGKKINVSRGAGEAVAFETRLLIVNFTNVCR